MGTTKRLTISVHPSLYNYPEIQGLIEKGHNVYCNDMGSTDIVLAPNAWRMTPELLPYLDLSIKQARAMRYPKKEKVA